MDGFGNYDALAGSIKAEDVASDEMNADILRRIMENKSREYLYICSEEDRESEDYCPANADEMGWLGYFVGKSTTIRSLQLYSGIDNFNALMEPFCRGISTNNSISEVEMFGLQGEEVLRMMAPFFKQNHSLAKFSAEECNFGPEGGRLLSLAIGGCTSRPLTHVTLSECAITDEQFADIAIALSMHPNLMQLVVNRNNIGRNGCMALAHLLQWSATKLGHLDLEGNEIDDDAMEALAPALAECKELTSVDLSDNSSISVRGWRALAGLLKDSTCALQRLDVTGIRIGDETLAIFANALANNQTFTHLCLGFGSANSTITEKGWTVISQLLCDTSSVNKTFLSNHTLRFLGNYGVPGDVETCLKLNRKYKPAKEANKKEIAMMKILANHQDLSMQPFFEWEFKVLPLFIDWLERVESIAALDAATLGGIPPRKLSAIYQFVRGLPLLYVESHLRVQLEEIKSCKSKLGKEELKLRQERLMVELKQEEVARRKREIETREQSIMARLSG